MKAIRAVERNEGNALAGREPRVSVDSDSCAGNANGELPGRAIGSHQVVAGALASTDVGDVAGRNDVQVRLKHVRVRGKVEGRTVPDPVLRAVGVRTELMENAATD